MIHLACLFIFRIGQPVAILAFKIGSSLIGRIVKEPLVRVPIVSRQKSVGRAWRSREIGFGFSFSPRFGRNLTKEIQLGILKLIAIQQFFDFHVIGAFHTRDSIA